MRPYGFRQTGSDVGANNYLPLRNHSFDYPENLWLSHRYACERQDFLPFWEGELALTWLKYMSAQLPFPGAPAKTKFLRGGSRRAGKQGIFDSVVFRGSQKMTFGMIKRFIGFYAFIKTIYPPRPAAFYIGMSSQTSTGAAVSHFTPRLSHRPRSPRLPVVLQFFVMVDVQ